MVAAGENHACHGFLLQAVHAFCATRNGRGDLASRKFGPIGEVLISASATDVIKEIDIAGVLDISQITSNAGSTSDGNQGTPTASLHMAGVTVDGQPAYIDNQGVHVSGTSTSSSGVTPQQAQNALDGTFAQDGIQVRLLDPETTSNGAEGIANSGGLVVSVSHQFDVPYIPDEPTIPVPELGNTGLPAGVYTATTSITLGSVTTDVQASQAQPALGSGTGLSADPPGATSAGIGLGLATGGGLGLTGSSLSSPAGIVPSTSAAGPSPSTQALGPSASSRLPLGIPVPVGWLIVAVLACVFMTYPMLLAARWQFLSGRGR